MSELQDYINQVQFLVHDQAAVDFSTLELTNAINNARNAVALDFHCVRSPYLSPPVNAPNSTLYRPVSMILNQEAYQLLGANSQNGQIVGANVITGGSGYTAPIVAFAAPPAGGVQALGVATVTNGVVTGINMTQWGSGYTPGILPSVTITDSTGAGAAAVATQFNNVFNVISISYIWGNQRYMLRFRGFTLFQAYLRSQTTFSSRALVWTIHQESGLVLVQPPPDQPYTSEWDVLSLPIPLVNTTDIDSQVIAPASDAVQYYAAMLCLTKLQNFQQAEYMQQKYDARVPRIIIGAGGVRIPNPYNKNFQRRMQRG